MKALIILSLALVSLNAFAANVGEEQKSDCAAASQTNKREAKEVEKQVSETKVEETKSVQK